MGKRKTGRPAAGPGQRPAPATADPRQQLAALVAAYQAGRFDEVTTGARRFTREWPDQVVGWNLLTEGHRLAGRLDEAESASQRALAVAPQSAEAHNNRGNLLRDRGDPRAAEAAYRRALSIRPDLVEARYNLGNALRDQGRLHEAVEAFHEAIARRPGEFLYHCTLGAALRDLDRPEAARAALEQALSIRPDHAETHNDFGNVLRELGAYDGARHAFERAIELRPDLTEAHNNLGMLLRAMGETEAAEACIREALRLDPGHTSACYNLALTRRFGADDPDLAAFERLLGRDDLTTSDRIRLHFAIGKALVDTDADAAQVFRHYREGCRLKRGTFDYEPGAVEDLCARIAHCCSADWLQSVPAGGDATEAPILVVGMPRSGTTLVEQVLASHPRAYGAGECKDLGRLVAAEGERAGCPYPEWLPGISAEQLTRIGAGYRERVLDPHPGQRVVDKMPSNFRYLGLVAAALSGARIVHIRRDPLDTCLSCFMHLFRESQPFSYDLEELGRYYRAYAGLMAHWRAVLPPGRMLELEYEELVREPEPRIRDLLAHCGLEWDPACLDFHVNRRSVVTASVMQVRQPMYRSAVGRWHKYRDQLGPLIDALGPLAPEDVETSA